MPIERTYQLNVGGNTDFLNMLERSRLESKKISKTNAVTSQIRNRGLSIDADNVHVGPSDHVPWLKDNKVCYLRVEGRHFGDVPMDLESRLSVEDSPNSAGVISDAVRFAKLALDNGLKGAITGPSSYLFKTPPIQYTDDEARRFVADYIEKYGEKKEKNTPKAKAK
jgi:myo-inositol-1-phosphate synthase